MQATAIYSKNIVTKTDTTVLISKSSEMKPEYFKFVLAFLNTQIAQAVAFSQVKQGGGNTIAAFPKYVKDLKIPNAQDDVVAFVAKQVALFESGDFSTVGIVDEIFSDLVTNNNLLRTRTRRTVGEIERTQQKPLRKLKV